MRKPSKTNPHLTVSVKYNNNDSIFEFEVPLNTKMKNINQVLWKNKNQFETSKQKLIGFQNISENLLLDYCLYNGIDTLKKHLTLRPLYKNAQLQGLEKYKILKCLATGGFSKVYLVRSLQNGQFYAAKFVDKLKVSTQERKVLIMNEKTVNEKSNYQFLVKMHDFIETSNFYVFIMDYCPGGQLFFLLRKIKRMTQEEARTYFVQILLGIEYLHSRGIMYRDLKPQNIMIDKNGHVKIADFGLAKFTREKSYSFCGSIQYMSPQIVTNAGHSFQVDYYCLGALLYELLIGCPPFYDPELSEYETKKNIAYAKVQFPDQLNLSDEVKDLISKLLVKNPNKRLGHFGGAKEIMLHPWVGKINRQFIQSKNFEPPFSPNLNQFNFDPNQIGMSEQRFTYKIQRQYQLLKQNEDKIIKNENKEKDQKNQSFKKNISPCAKNFPLKMRKSSKNMIRKPTSNLKNKNQINKSHSNLKGQSYQTILKSSIKKKFISNKSQIFGQLKEKNLLNNPQPQYYIQKKIHSIKTESDEDNKNKTLNKSHKYQKMITEANQLLKQVSNKDKQKSKNKQNKNLLTHIEKNLKEKQKCMLKKSSKIQVKKIFIQNILKKEPQQNLFRKTCIN